MTNIINIVNFITTETTYGLETPSCSVPVLFPE